MHYIEVYFAKYYELGTSPDSSTPVYTNKKEPFFPPPLRLFCPLDHILQN